MSSGSHLFRSPHTPGLKSVWNFIYGRFRQDFCARCKRTTQYLHNYPLHSYRSIFTLWTATDMSHSSGTSQTLNAEVSDRGSDSWYILVHVHGKQFNISAGEGTQRIKWLGHVAIARWDEENNQGWKKLGIPTIIRHKHKEGVEVPLGAVIRETLQNGDQLFLTTSLHPNETSG